MNTLVRKYYKCPFCGVEQPVWYDMYETPPHYFRCDDCLRHFGDVGEMSEAEKTEYYNESFDCTRTMGMYNLATILSVVETFFRNYRPGCGDLPIVHVRDGEVKYTGSDLSRPLLARYSAISPISDQWLCVQCYFHLKKVMPYTTFTLGHYGVSMG